MLSKLLAFAFRCLGWKIIGRIPYELPKGIWVVAPHFSNFDFFVGLGVRAQMGIYIGYLAKAELFKWYSGWLFKSLGGYPVYRDSAHNLVDAVAGTFRSHERIHIAIAPEGTRNDVAKLKTGFYYMAWKSEVPLIMVGFDYVQKAVILSEPFFVSGDYEKDKSSIYSFFLQVKGPRKTWLREYSDSYDVPSV